ncbi:unnamed protein product [Moneuplotes crassus]|uniref:Uncharacterized protein n=1 Tax=Euplotes crassus TaxID=5936 RepID=A0AAD2DAL2_EUPCR|nr:unnamed protein product [Moneuplotes crassus]
MARGSSKKNTSTGGNGNVVDNSYCLTAGIDCSATCCIQQTCGATLADCEFGYDPNANYLLYTAIAVISIVFLMPVIAKVCIYFNVMGICKKRISKKGEPLASMKMSFTEIIGTYLCCCLTFCRASRARDINRKEIMDPKAKLQFKSNVMKKLEQSHFVLDDSIDPGFMDGTLGSGSSQRLFKGDSCTSKTKIKPGYLDEVDIENPAFGEDGIGKIDSHKSKINAHKNITDSLNTDSIRSGEYGELRKGLSSGDKGVTKAPDSKEAERKDELIVRSQVSGSANSSRRVVPISKMMTEIPREGREETKHDGTLEDVEEDLILTEEAPEEDSKEANHGINKDSEILDTDLMNQIVQDHPSEEYSPQSHPIKDRKSKVMKVEKDLEMEKEQSDLEEIKKSQDIIEKEWKELEGGV